MPYENRFKKLLIYSTAEDQTKGEEWEEREITDSELQGLMETISTNL